MSFLCDLVLGDLEEEEATANNFSDHVPTACTTTGDTDDSVNDVMSASVGTKRIDFDEDTCWNEERAKSAARKDSLEPSREPEPETPFATTSVCDSGNPFAYDIDGSEPKCDLANRFESDSEHDSSEACSEQGDPSDVGIQPEREGHESGDDHDMGNLLEHDVPNSSLVLHDSSRPSLEKSLVAFGPPSANAASIDAESQNALLTEQRRLADEVSELRGCLGELVAEVRFWRNFHMQQFPNQDALAIRSGKTILHLQNSPNNSQQRCCFLPELEDAADDAGDVRSETAKSSATNNPVDVGNNSGSFLSGSCKEPSNATGRVQSKTVENVKEIASILRQCSSFSCGNDMALSTRCTDPCTAVALFLQTWLLGGRYSLGAQSVKNKDQLDSPGPDKTPNSQCVVSTVDEDCVAGCKEKYPFDTGLAMGLEECKSKSSKSMNPFGDDVDTGISNSYFGAFQEFSNSFHDSVQQDADQKCCIPPRSTVPGTHSFHSNPFESEDESSNASISFTEAPVNRDVVTDLRRRSSNPFDSDDDAADASVKGGEGTVFCHQSSNPFDFDDDTTIGA